MSRKLIYLINPISGTKEKNSLTKLISEKTGAQGLSFEILPTVASGDYTFLKEKIEEEHITDVVICGSAVHLHRICIPDSTGIFPG